MTTLWIALVVTSLIYATRSAFRTFRRDMEVDANVWLMVICLGVIVFCCVATNI